MNGQDGPTPAELRALLSQTLDATQHAWWVAAEGAVVADPEAVRTAFPAVGRHVGRAVLTGDGGPGSWTSEDAVRALLLVALGPAAAHEVADLHRFGDADEQRAIVRSLGLLPEVPGARAMVDAAVRTNDPRTLAAALSPWALSTMDDDAIAQAGLKCVFSGVALTAVPGLLDHANPRFAEVLAGYVHERVAAGRTVPAEVWRVIDEVEHTPATVTTLAAIATERRHRDPARRQAADEALTARERER